MSWRKKGPSIAFTGTTAFAAIAFTAGPAHAAGVSEVTVTPGGHYTAAAVGSPVLVDNKTQATLTCAVGTASGNLSGSTAGNKVGSVKTADFSTCSVATLQFTAHLNKPATFHATSPTAGGVTKGSLSGISATISGQSGFSCVAVVTGTLLGSYTNSSTLKIDPNHSPTLTVKTATHCAGELNSMDSAFFAATYKVAPPQKVSAK